ncbi:MAG: hypothetical protein ACFFCM_10940 [Promethearchaeota archaeon]
MKNPREVANLVIKAIRDNDIDLMVRLFNTANRRKFLPLTGEKRKIMLKLRQNELKKIADITEVQEIRKAPFYIRYDSVIVKVNQIGNDVHIIVLSKEDDGYYFEDFNILNVMDYQKLKKLEF